MPTEHNHYATSDHYDQMITHNSKFFTPKTIRSSTHESQETCSVPGNSSQECRLTKSTAQLLPLLPLSVTYSHPSNSLLLTLYTPMTNVLVIALCDVISSLKMFFGKSQKGRGRGGWVVDFPGSPATMVGCQMAGVLAEQVRSPWPISVYLVLHATWNMIALCTFLTKCCCC